MIKKCICLMRVSTEQQKLEGQKEKVISDETVTYTKANNKFVSYFFWQRFSLIVEFFLQFLLCYFLKIS
jgi:hypothetical protein